MPRLGTSGEYDQEKQFVLVPTSFCISLSYSHAEKCVTRARCGSVLTSEKPYRLGVGIKASSLKLAVPKELFRIFYATQEIVRSCSEAMEVVLCFNLFFFFFSLLYEH